MSGFRPMLAPADSPKTNPNYFARLAQGYPYYTSPKFDGIRGATRSSPVLDVNEDLVEFDTGEVKTLVLSKTLTPLPSRQVQTAYSHLTGLDGEIIAGNATDFGVYNRTQSFVMSKDKPAPLLQYLVFDTCDDEMAGVPFEGRIEYLRELIKMYNSKPLLAGCELHYVEHKLCHNYEELMEAEHEALQAGYEGLMLRSPWSPYKWNRATFLEGFAFKLKRSQDDEGIIVGFEEGFKNMNAKTTDNRGYTERSTKQSGLVPSGTLGKVLVDFRGEIIKVAPGAFTHKQRQDIWDNQEKYRYSFLKFRHFAHGATSVPRHARALGFRDKMDM